MLITMKKYYKSEGIDPFTVLPLTYTITANTEYKNLDNHPSFIKLKI